MHRLAVLLALAFTPLLTPPTVHAEDHPSVEVLTCAIIVFKTGQEDKSVRHSVSVRGEHDGVVVFRATNIGAGVKWENTLPSDPELSHVETVMATKQAAFDPKKPFL